MNDQKPKSNSFTQPIAAPLANAEDKKFEAAPNVDVDAEGKVVNGPYVDPGSYREPAKSVKNVRAGDNPDESDSLFVAADNTANGTFIQPGIVQPMAPLGTPIDNRTDLTPEEERER
jgi:hypothetical protein